ncbi:MAG: glycosyltransferase family 2 protein [Halothece sp.]
MRLSACVTTMNAAQDLNACLQALWNSNVKPYAVIVSDDSPNPERQQQNRQIVEHYPGTTYLQGPRRGVNANRNHAVNAVSDTDLIAFVDDDVCVASDFIEKAITIYEQMSPQQQNYTFITGNSNYGKGQETPPTRLSFRGYYTATTEAPECVHIHSAVFPRSFFNQEQWEEDIFFGQGDAILCLRALRRGYRIIYCPELKVSSHRLNAPTLRDQWVGKLTNYNIHQEAARLNIGIKRYKYLFPNYWKLILFLIIYFSHMTIYLLRKQALRAWPLIIQRSQMWQLLFGDAPVIPNSYFERQL